MLAISRRIHAQTKLSPMVAAIALSATCFLLAPNAKAQTMTQQATIQQETTLNLTGKGNFEAAPDIASISLGVNVNAETASAAMKQQAKLMSNVFDAIEKAGVEKKDMQTGNISLNPRYDYSSRNNGPPKLTGYQATNTVGITVRELESLGEVLDAVVNAGGNTINSVSFGLSDTTQAMKSARQAAVKDALSKAELYAEAAGYQVSRIITMNESGNHTPQPQPMMMARMEMADSASTPIAAGEVSFSSTMNVQFELTKK